MCAVLSSVFTSFLPTLPSLFPAAPAITCIDGAYYYYNFEKSKSAQATLVDVKAYADKEGIPYKYVLLDSWWYPKGGDGGVKEWVATEQTFPTGLADFYKQTGWKVQAHNRHWSKQNVYASFNGGGWPFSRNDSHLTVPLTQGFWDSFMRNSTLMFGGAGSDKNSDADDSDGGQALVVYEQDWCVIRESSEFVSL